MIILMVLLLRQAVLPLTPLTIIPQAIILVQDFSLIPLIISLTLLVIQAILITPFI